MALIAALVLQLSQEDAIRGLIEQLSADRIEARADAYRRLEEIGRPALDQLRKASSDSDDERASRARMLLVRIPIREHLTPALIAGVAGIYDRLAVGEWRAVFLDLALDLRQPEQRRRFPGVRADDLSFMAPMAIDSAQTEGDRAAVCQAAGRLKLRTAIPSIVNLLRDDRVVVRSNAIGALRDIEARDQVAVLRPYMADPNALVRSVVAHALGRLGDKEAVPGLKALLKDDAANVRWWAVHALGELKAADAVEDLRALDKDPDVSVRRIVAETLKALDTK